MKLLFDENISYKLVTLLADVFPSSAHVRDVNLQHASDSEVWEFAKAGGYTICSKDDDFHQRSFVFGFPPKIIWLRLGNCTTDRIASLLRARAADIIAFEAEAEASFLSLS